MHPLLWGFRSREGFDGRIKIKTQVVLVHGITILRKYALSESTVYCLAYFSLAELTEDTGSY